MRHSSNLLHDEFPIVVSRRLAKIIGLNEAVILQQINYWVQNNRRNNKNLHDGRYWTYNTIEAWQEKEFSFVSVRTLKRHFSKLKELGLLLTANYNQSNLEKTLWYSIDYDALDALQSDSDKMTLSKGSECHSPECQNGQLDSANVDSSYNEQRIHTDNTKSTTTDVDVFLMEKYGLSGIETKISLNDLIRVCNEIDKKGIKGEITNVPGYVRVVVEKWQGTGSFEKRKADAEEEAKRKAAEELKIKESEAEAERNQEELISRLLTDHVSDFEEYWQSLSGKDQTFYTNLAKGKPLLESAFVKSSFGVWLLEKYGGDGA